jgi:hypothetical protein
MKRILFASAIALMVCATAVQAQDSLSSTRIETQHKETRFMKKHLPDMQENLLKTLETQNPVMQAHAVQTIRELEQVFPKYAFALCLAPLGTKLKDENADPTVRRLAALALDELHSDAGDAVITDVASSSQDKGLQTLCKALLVRSDYK